MTYKELLFKMADKGMLELSNKDERGLFWAGMSNMDALNQPFNWEDFSHKYSKEDIDGMRETLAEAEWEGLKDRDLRQILREGCDGWENIADRDVIEMYENIYGETDNVEIVQEKNLGEQVEQIICDKQLNKQLNKRHGKITAKFNDIK